MEWRVDNINRLTTNRERKNCKSGIANIIGRTENRCLRNIARIEKNIRNIVASIIWQIEKKSVKRRSIGKHYHKLNTERMEKVVEKL